jgi:protein TonB
MAEGGLSDDPGISALSESPLASEPTLTVPSLASSPRAPDESDESSAHPFETFATPVEVSREALPLIGASDTSSTLPLKLPTKHHDVPAATPERQSTPDAAPADRVSSATAGSSGASPAAAPQSTSTIASAAEPGLGAAPFTPPHPTGRGAGLSGRRGARGLDHRGLPIPDYPRQSRLRREEGTVVLDVAVNAVGHVESVLIVSSSGYALLDAAAAIAIREAEFTPALLGGRPVGGTVRVPYRFRLD